MILFFVLELVQETLFTSDTGALMRLSGTHFFSFLFFLIRIKGKVIREGAARVSLGGRGSMQGAGGVVLASCWRKGAQMEAGQGFC